MDWEKEIYHLGKFHMGRRSGNMDHMPGMKAVIDGMVLVECIT